jgi:hypothetical protein
MNVALTKIEYTIKRYNQIWTFWNLIHIINPKMCTL